MLINPFDGAPPACPEAFPVAPLPAPIMARHKVRLKYLICDAPAVWLGWSIIGPDSMLPLLAALFSEMSAEQEHAVAVFLNARHRPVGYTVIGKGTANSCIVHPRDVFRDAIRLNACGAIFVHNHPSGSLDPSDDDRVLTRRLIQSGELLGVRLLDSLIYSHTGGLYSMAANGLEVF